MSQNPQPILSFIDGVDQQPRYLTADEIKQLTSSGAGLGDWFAQWLAATSKANRAMSYRDIIKALPPDSFYKTFAIADGTPIVYDHKNPDNPLNSVSRHLRFITVAMPDVKASEGNLSKAILKRTLSIVGSSNLDGKTVNAFLQCASWDPDAYKKGMGMTRFYQRDAEWEYFGDGFNAVSFSLLLTVTSTQLWNLSSTRRPRTLCLFAGMSASIRLIDPPLTVIPRHVGGALIMKVGHL